jgi:hypothetical protein
MMKAIVLEGGGGKGAYQIGALLALRYAGIEFDVIAGSSVDALNGFLLSTGQLNLGFRYWWNLRPRQVFHIRLAGLIYLLIAPMYWIGHGLMSFNLHRPAKLADGILWAAVFGAIGTIALLLIYAAGEPRAANGLVFFPMISVALAMPFIIKYFRI